MMMERLKTALLLVLVAASLAQSYVLSYSTPKFDRVTQQTDYVETEPNGTQAELADVILPDQIILHFGKKTHTVLRPNDSFYSMIMTQLLKRRTFDGFRRTTASSALNWDTIRNEQQGIEVRFKEGVPISILKGLVQIKEDVPVDNDLITRIWIYNNAVRDEVKTYFFTDSGSVVYEAVKADVTASDVENKVALGGFLPKYHSEFGDYYLPDEEIPAIRIRQPYTQFAADKLKRSLFVDPELTRFLMERDGTQIYTDGKRGLQIQSDRRLLVYTDPIYATDSKVDTKDNFLTGLQFINQHGGWNGTFLYGKGNVRTAGNGAQTFWFRQYVEGLPVLSTPNDTYGYIKLSLLKGTVSGYERSMLVPDMTKPATKTPLTLSGGKELDQLINGYTRKGQIASVFPAYRATVSEQYIDYMPQWAVELRDGTVDLLGR